MRRPPPEADVSWRTVCHAQPACESPAKRLGRAFQACGAVAEWSKALAWKVSIRQKRIEGSNPSRSASWIRPSTHAAAPDHVTGCIGGCRGVVRLQKIRRLEGSRARWITRAIGPRARAERAAYLPQERRIAWNLPAVEVAALGAPFLAGEAALDLARAALDEVGVGHLADRGVAEMSGGERARVLLARALVAPGRALLVDEPVAGLDPDAQLLVMDRLRQEAQAGRGVMVSLHDLTLAARYADRVLLMLDGDVLFDGPPMEALSPWHLDRAFGLTAEWVQGPDGPLLSARRN